MRLFSVQGVDHWLAIQKVGYLSGGSGSHVDADWHDAYLWMREQMQKRLPVFTGDFPVWAWKWSGPESLWKSGWAEPGTRMMLLGFDVPESRVLLSDFVTWNLVLGRSPLVEDEDAEPTPEETRKSWERIFDPHGSGLVPDWTDGEPMQACVDRVYLTEVFHVAEFVVEPDDETDDET